MAKPLNSAIIQIHVAHLKPTTETFSINGIAMVLCCDVNPACLQVADGVISTTMAKFELERLPAKRSPDELVSQTDAHNGLCPDELSYSLLHVTQIGWVSWPRRQYNAIWLQSQDVVR